MSKLLDKNNIITFFKFINNKYLKNGEILLVSPKIRQEISKSGFISIQNIIPNTYIKVYNEITSQIKFGKIINQFNDLIEHKNKIYIQFESGISEDIKYEFADNIFWKDGKSLKVQSNKLYLIELTCGKNVVYGEWVYFDKNENK